MDPEPATRPNIGRHEEKLGFRFYVVILRACRRVQPQRDATITVMVDHVRRKAFAAYAKIGEAVRNDLLGFRKREAHLSNRVVHALSHAVSLPQGDSSVSSTNGLQSVPATRFWR